MQALRIISSVGLEASRVKPTCNESFGDDEEPGEPVSLVEHVLGIFCAVNPKCEIHNVRANGPKSGHGGESEKCLFPLRHEIYVVVLVEFDDIVCAVAIKSLEARGRVCR